MRGSTPSSSSGRERIALPISPRKCSPAMATALLRSLDVQSTTASHRSTESATGSTGTPHRTSSRLNPACMLAWAASWRRKASPSARVAPSATRGSRRRASSMKKPSTTGAIAVGATAAFVAVGAKAEATIELGECRDPTTGEVQLHEGDEIEATVVDDGTRSGSIVLKRVAGRGGHVPGELEQAFAHGIAIEGLVTGENTGGYDVQIGSVRAFWPGSQIDRRRIEP